MNDDLDEAVIDSEDGFDEFSQKASVVDTIRQSPVAKIIIVVVALALVGGVMVMFGGESIEQQDSFVPGGSDVSAVPGSSDVIAPAYIKAVEDQNEADLERAMIEGGSSIPVPIETHGTRLEVPEVEEESEDPLHRWRLLQEERVEREMRSKEAEVEPVTVLNAEQQNEAITQLADSMVEQMESVLSSTTASKKFTTETYIKYDEESGSNGADGYASASSGGNGGASGFSEDSEEIVIIPAGKIIYGQMLLEANSDVPSIVLAEMVSGPLKGYKLLGEFEVFEDIELLGVSFDIAVDEDGKQYGIDAVMLNPDTGLAAMRTDIDHRYIKRIVLPAAASFIEGYAEAIAESGGTSVTVEGGAAVETEEEKDEEQEVATGVSDAASDVAEILDDIADVPVKIIIEAGTPIGIFFTENVVEDEGDI